jgi:hypothetical protein
MKNITRHEGKLEILKRLDNSYNGNPRFLISINGFTCKTAVDSMLAYGITNYENREVIATIGTHYGTATLDSLKGINK